MPGPGSGRAGSSVLEAMQVADGHDFGSRRRREYTNWIDEQRSWKEACYLGDWSFLANVRLSGHGALDLLSGLSVNSFDRFDVGRAKHLVQCQEGGKVVAEGVCHRRDEATFELHGVPAYWTAYHLDAGNVEATVAFRDTFNYQVQGPKAVAVLEAVTDGSLRDISFLRSGTVTIAGRDVTALRMGMSGEVGFELQGPAEHGEAVWQAVLEAGREHGLRRLGARTSSLNHLEAAFPTRGRDYVPAVFGDDLAGYRRWLRERATRDLLTYPIEGSFDAADVSAWYRSPVELGWASNVGLDHDFVGRAALEAEVAEPDRTLATLVWNAADVVDVYAALFSDGRPHKVMDMPHQQHRAMVADEVRADGSPVGVATCRGYSYHFREMLSLAVLDVDVNEPGREVTVVWGEGADPASPAVEPHEPKAIRATVAPAPYKEDNRRTDLA